jgi:hypothetical protein
LAILFYFAFLALIAAFIFSSFFNKKHSNVDFSPILPKILQAGQLLQNPIVIPFLDFSTKIERTRSLFSPFPIIFLFFLVIAAMYFYFGTVIEEFTLILTLVYLTLFLLDQEWERFSYVIHFLI